VRKDRSALVARAALFPQHRRAPARAPPGTQVAPSRAMNIYNRLSFPVLLLASAFSAGCGGAEDATSADAEDVASVDSALTAQCSPDLLRVTQFAPDFTSDIPQKVRDLRITARNQSNATCSRAGTVGIRDLSGKLLAVERIPARDFPKGFSDTQFNFVGRYLPPITANVCYGSDLTCLQKQINEPIGE
jgi:hypothetical protein